MHLSRDFQVLRKAFHVVESLHFFASEARLTTVEVVVEACAADPAVLRELESFISPYWLLNFSTRSLELLLFFTAGLLFGLESCNKTSFDDRFLLFRGLEVGSKNSSFYLGHRLLEGLGLKDNTRLEHLSDLVLLAGLYLSEDSVTASRLGALSEDCCGHQFRVKECLTEGFSLTWFASSLFLHRLILHNFFHLKRFLDQLRGHILVGMVGILVCDGLLGDERRVLTESSKGSLNSVLISLVCI